MDTNPGWTLQPLWQYGTPSYSSGGPAGGFTDSKVIAYNLGGSYENRLATIYATTPAIDCSSAASATLRFKRWLKLKNGDTATIQVSTNGMTWVDVWTTTRTVSDSAWQEVQYALPTFAAGSPTVQLRWGLGSGPSQNEIGWNLDDVEIFGNGNLDTVPPGAVLNVANITTGGAPGHEFAVTYSDNVAVNVATLGAGDVLVTGPNGYSNVVAFAGVDVPNNGSPRIATYSALAPTGTWVTADNGVYDVTLRAAEVADTAGNYFDETVLGQFTVAISTAQQMLLVSPTVLSILEGASATAGVRLAEQPSADMTVTIVPVSGDSDIVIESGATNVFTSLNWSTAVPVVFRSLADADQLNGTAIFELRSDGLASVTILATEQDTTPDNTLTVTSNHADWGTIDPAGGTYAVWSSVQVTAIPNAYFEFAQWSGDLPGVNNPITVEMNSNVTLQAEFRELATTNHATPYWWLASYGQTSDFDAAEILTGANGIPLWQSYIAGLDPTDPESQFRLSIAPGTEPTTWVLRWNPATNRLYTVMQSINLEQGFSPLSAASALPSSVQSYTNTAAGSSPLIFYRMEVQKP
jgi:hypothetical protein